MKIEIFLSYSHNDEKFKDKLITHLASLKRRGIVSDWHDREIVPGEDLDKNIKQELREAEIILFLVSADFVASDYIYNIEIKHSLERHEQNDAIVIPIILRPCDWKDLNFGTLKALPKDGKPITRWDDEDNAYLNIVEGIKRATKKISKRANKEEKDPKNDKIYLRENSILIKLPRGYIILSSLDYQDRNSWAITASYEFYDQSWGGGTHYNESYHDKWLRSDYREIQFRKLQIPIADHSYAEPVIDLIMDLRERESDESIEEVLNNYQYLETPIKFFKEEQNLDPTEIGPPEKFKWLNETGEIRDLAKEFSVFAYQNYELRTLKERFDSNRRQSYLLLYEKLPENHPALNFVKEVVDEYDKGMDLQELENWSRSMCAVLNDALDHIN